MEKETENNIKTELKDEDFVNVAPHPRLHKRKQYWINKNPAYYFNAMFNKENREKSYVEDLEQKFQSSVKDRDEKIKEIHKEYLKKYNQLTIENRKKLQSLKEKYKKNHIESVIKFIKIIRLSNLSEIFNNLVGILGFLLLVICCYFLVIISQDFYSKNDNGLINPLLQALVLELAPFILIFIPIKKMHWLKNILIFGLVIYNLTITISPQLTPFLKKAISEYKISEEMDNFLNRKRGEVEEVSGLKNKLLEVDHVTSAKKVQQNLKSKREKLDLLQERKIKRLEEGRGLEWIEALDIIPICLFRVFSIFIAFLLTHNLRYIFKKD